MKENLIRVKRIYKVEGDNHLKAFVDIWVGGLVIKNIRLVEGSNGLFLGMPRYRAKNGKFYDTVYFEDKEIKNALTQIVLSAYQG